MNLSLTGVRLAAVLIVSLSLSLPAAGQSLTDALIQSYHNSELLKAGRALLRSTDEGVATAVAATRPTLTGTTANAFSSGAVYSSNVTLTSTLTIWDYGSTKLAIKAAELNVKAGRQTLINTEQSVLLNAVTAFMDMRLNAQFVQLAENNVRVIGRQLQAAKDRYEVGEVTRTSVSQAEARLAGAHSELAARRGNLEITRQIYHTAVGSYPGVLQSPPPLPAVPSTVAAAQDIALRTHPDVIEARINQEVAEINVLRAEAAMRPSVSLTGTVTSSSSTGESGTLSLGTSTPIYQGGALSSAFRSTLALQEQSHYAVHQAGLVAKQSVVQSWAQLQIARATITARQIQVRAARVALRGVTEEASLGARTTLDVLDAEQELVSAQSNAVEAKRDEYVAVYSLLSSMGLLTVDHLRLGIRSYSADANFNKVKKAPLSTPRGNLLDRIFKRAGKK